MTEKPILAVGAIHRNGAAYGRRADMECRNCQHYKAKNCKHQCMYLPDGKTCADCIHVQRCTMIFGVKPENRSCGFEPIRFQTKRGD